MQLAIAVQLEALAMPTSPIMGPVGSSRWGTAPWLLVVNLAASDSAVLNRLSSPAAG